jgi:hypothetical protein
MNVVVEGSSVCNVEKTSLSADEESSSDDVASSKINGDDVVVGMLVEVVIIDFFVVVDDFGFVKLMKTFSAVVVSTFGVVVASELGLEKPKSSFENEIDENGSSVDVVIPASVDFL